MSDWTRDMVEDRIIEAADVLKRLPPVRLSGSHFICLYFGAALVSAAVFVVVAMLASL